MKVKSESEVAQSCPTLSDPKDCSPAGSSVHGIFQARVLGLLLALNEIICVNNVSKCFEFLCCRKYKNTIGSRLEISVMSVHWGTESTKKNAME